MRLHVFREICNYYMGSNMGDMYNVYGVGMVEMDGSNKLCVRSVAYRYIRGS